SDRGAAFGEGAVTFRERVTLADFESDHFGRQLVERLGWAVGDADAVEHVDEPTEAAYDRREPACNPGDPIDEIDDPAEPTRAGAGRIRAASPA
ncbi:MAG TPA: hypothetical protein VHZ27_01380, partial [Solirubrobacteraceae bacterium]|nr:hypothetical protein [Solirubrobacteraceae bacterium]